MSFVLLLLFVLLHAWQQHGEHSQYFSAGWMKARLDTMGWVSLGWVGNLMGWIVSVKKIGSRPTLRWRWQAGSWLVERNYYLCGYSREFARIERTIAFICRSARFVLNEIVRLAMSAVFLRSRPGSVPLHSWLLSDRATSLSESRMRRRIRRGAGVLRNTSGRDCGLLLWGVLGQKTRQPGTTCRRPAGASVYVRLNWLIE